MRNLHSHVTSRKALCLPCCPWIKCHSWKTFVCFCVKFWICGNHFDNNNNMCLVLLAAVTNMRAGVRHEAPTTLTSLHPDYGYDLCATIETTDAVDTMVHFECQGYPHGQYVVVQRVGTGYALVVGELVVVVEGKFTGTLLLTQINLD